MFTEKRIRTLVERKFSGSESARVPIPLLVQLVLELEDFGDIYEEYQAPLIDCLAHGILNNELRFFSINSKAINAENDSLKPKPQYKKNRSIMDKLNVMENRLKIPISYSVFLADMDVTLPIPEYEDRWEDNLMYLRSESGINTAVRLSSLVPERGENYFSKSALLSRSPSIAHEIERLRKSDTQVDFYADEQFIENQIIQYSATGLVLEEWLPGSILLDIQRKRYPFEQPFYNAVRTVKMPIIYCGYEE